MTIISTTCAHCGNQFSGNRRVHLKQKLYCSKKCSGLSKVSAKKIPCDQCGKIVVKHINQIKRSKSGKAFCTVSCATSYNNTHKKHGTTISKCELIVQEKLLQLYPTMEFMFNSKDVINSELDIYIPKLKLAFELNGIFHYEPIHGQTKLTKIQVNDANKFQLCQLHEISLCIIDTSARKFKPDKALKVIVDIIQATLLALE